MEEFGSSGSAGAYPPMKLLPMFRRERPERRYLQAEKRAKAFFRFNPPQDRPYPMEEPLPQDDDPNSSGLNPMRSPLLSRDLIFE